MVVSPSESFIADGMICLYCSWCRRRILTIMRWRRVYQSMEGLIYYVLVGVVAEYSGSLDMAVFSISMICVGGWVLFGRKIIHL